MKVELDSNLICKIQRLGHMDETIPEFIEKIVEHVSTCDEWWRKRDDE